MRGVFKKYAENRENVNCQHIMYIFKESMSFWGDLIYLWNNLFET